MFEPDAAPERHASAVEQDLRRLVNEIVERRVFVVAHEPHGRGSWARRCPDSEAADTVGVHPGGADRAEGEAGSDDGDDEIHEGFASLARLLAEGATLLQQAHEAATASSRAAARRARALAAFARCRPADGFDLPDDQVGAAAAATRAARPSVLTHISEWAADEVMAALAVTSATANRLLVEAVTLDELLPDTLTAAENGEIDWSSAQVLAELLPSVRDAEVRARLERRLLAYTPVPSCAWRPVAPSCVRMPRRSPSGP